jgi:hypothetical protein
MTTVNQILAGISVDIDDPVITATDASDLHPWINDAIELFTKRLWHLGAGLIKEEQSLDFDEDDQDETLPTGFRAIFDRPWISGTTTFLKPLESKSQALTYTDSGQPLYYEFKGGSMYIYPPTDEDLTIKFDAMMAPTEVTTGDSEIPFSGIYDMALKQYLIQRYKSSLLHADDYNNMIPGSTGGGNPFRAALMEAEFIALNRDRGKSKTMASRRPHYV